MLFCSGSGLKMLAANTPFTSAKRSSAATSFGPSERADSTNRSYVEPAAKAAPTTAPIEVPTTWEGVRPASSSALQAPAWANDLAPPPPKTATTLLSGTSVVPAIHHPTRAPFGRPVIPPLLVRRLRHDRRHGGRHAQVVERHVGDVARVGVALDDQGVPTPVPPIVPETA